MPAEAVGEFSVGVAVGFVFAVVLDEQELLDEWGREFLSESRRRTDLIRFGKFCNGVWWDKQPDADTHTIIFPLHRDVLNANPKLEQNEGYPRPE